MKLIFALIKIALKMNSWYVSHYELFNLFFIICNVIIFILDNNFDESWIITVWIRCRYVPSQKCFNQ